MTTQKLIIEADHTESRYWKDLWRYRELFFFLAWRDILVRYKQTAIGIIWVLIRPLLTMLVFTFVFGNLAKLPSNGVPYPVLVFTGLLPWQFFAGALGEASSSLLSSSNLISKVYFPRIIIPGSAVIVSLTDFMISGVFLVILMAWYGIMPGIYVLVLPLFIFITFCGALGLGLWFAALTVKYRDFRFVVPFLVQFGLYISPVGFSSDLVPDQLRWLYNLNPMVGVIDGFRWALLGGNFQVFWPGFIISCCLVVLVGISGVWYFRRTEQVFADII